MGPRRPSHRSPSRDPPQRARERASTAGANAEAPNLRGGEAPATVGGALSPMHPQHQPQSPMRPGRSSSQTLPFLQQPSREEALAYYNGIPSRPILIGRTSSASHPYETIASQEKTQGAKRRAKGMPPTTFFSQRRLTPGPLGHHPIRKRYTAQVNREFIQCLRPLRWSTIDFVRLIPSDSDDDEIIYYTGQVVIWVGLETGNYPWDTVAGVLRACRRVLDRENLLDVDIQLRVSSVVGHSPGGSTGPASTSHSGSSDTKRQLLSPLDSATLPSEIKTGNPFTTAIGQPIFPTRNQTVRGTLGMYFWPAGLKSHVLFGLTCRHVGMAKQNNEELDLINLAKTNKLGSLQHNHRDYHGIGLADQAKVDAYIDLVLQSQSELTAEFRAETSEAKKNDFRPLLGVIDILAKTVVPFKDAKTRLLGTTIYSPPIGSVARNGVPGKWTRDLCVFQLDSSKFPGGKGSRISMSTPWPANFVDLRSQNKADIGRLLNSFPTCMTNPNRPPPPRIQFEYPDRGLLRLRGIIPTRELFCAPGPTANANEMPCTVVGKYGAQSGLTWGWTSEMASIKRDYSNNADVGEFWSYEVAVYGVGESGTTTKGALPFSEAGDSGSAVFGIDGRLAGFLTGGTKRESSSNIDVTYVTPAAFVLNDIEQALGIKVAFE